MILLSDSLFYGFNQDSDAGSRLLLGLVSPAKEMTERETSQTFFNPRSLAVGECFDSVLAAIASLIIWAILMLRGTYEYF